MWFAHSRKFLSESLFGHIARYAPSQTFKKNTSDSAPIPISELLEPPLKKTTNHKKTIYYHDFI